MDKFITARDKLCLIRIHALHGVKEGMEGDIQGKGLGYSDNTLLNKDACSE
jgi:hypothetical protein